MIRLSAVILVFLGLVLPMQRMLSAATLLTEPQQRVVLVVRGDLSKTNKTDAAWFDLPMIEEIGSETVTTSTPVLEGISVFRGVSFRKLLEYLGVENSEKITALGIDGYRQVIPVSDLLDNNAIIAFKRNGEYMSVRERGPLWIIIPDIRLADGETLFEAKPYLEAFMVWQLVRLDIK